MTKMKIIVPVFIAACNAGDTVPPDIQITDSITEGGLGDTGDTDTGGSNPSECWLDGAPAEAVRWQCEGIAEAAIIGTVHIDLPGWVDPTGLWQSVIDYGRYDWRALFGPWNGETYDDPGVDACCAIDIGRNEEPEGADETGGDPMTGGGDAVPQAAIACAHDCVDQACRDVPRTLRDLANEAPWGVPVSGPTYREQLRALANWVAAHQQECYDAMVVDGVHERLGAHVIDGTWSVPNSAEWPDVTDLSVEGECRVYDWVLPEQGEPQACTGLNDNNGEDPFEGGSSLGAFDTFAPTEGAMHLDGPMVLGVQATASVPLLGLGDACAREECSRLDAWVTPDALELRRMALVAPSELRWEREGMVLAVDGLHALVEHPLTLALEEDGAVKRFEIPAGRVSLLVAGQVHGVPMKVEVPSATPLTGFVFPLFDGSHGIVIDPFTVEHRDAHGTWSLRVTLGELVAVDHAPRATFDVRDSAGVETLDASASFDPDGDALVFEWYQRETLVGEGPVLELEPSADEPAPALRVIDGTGRAVWSTTPSNEGP